MLKLVATWNMETFAFVQKTGGAADFYDICSTVVCCVPRLGRK